MMSRLCAISFTLLASPIVLTEENSQTLTGSAPELATLAIISVGMAGLVFLRQFQAKS